MGRLAKNVFLGCILLAFVVFVAAIFIHKPAVSLRTKHKRIVQNWYDGLLFKSKSYVYEFIRTIGYAYEGGADIGECVATALQIKDGDDLSWYKQWLKTAERIYNFAQQKEKEGNIVSAREAYFRASNYFRTAGFFLRSKEELPKALGTWRKSKDSFLKAISSLPDVEAIRIPYKNTTLPGYFLKTQVSKNETPPLLIVHTGFDGTGEELYFSIGKAAVKRGYNCLIFEGPGQGEVIRVQKLPFRYDWEKVVTPVVDYAVSRPDVDKNKIALMGLSMGGYLAPRAVAFEHRIKACIANGGVYDFSAGFYKNVPGELAELVKENPSEFNAEIEKAIKENSEARWYFDNGMWVFGAKSPADFVKKIKKYTLKGVVKRIKCDMLVVDSEDDMFFKGQAIKLYQELDCPKKYLLFTRKETAQAHCQVGATAISNEMVFNWLDKVLGRK